VSVSEGSVSEGSVSTGSVSTGSVSDQPPCRSCGGAHLRQFLDLGSTPLADALVPADRVGQVDDTFPLQVAFCPDCTLVQITEEVPAERLFDADYPYFSSFSDHLLTHSREHALGLIEKRGLGPQSLVVELASNDGYLLKNFVEAGVPVLGIEPTPGPAKAAEALGVRTLQEFFGTALAEKLRADGVVADVIVANNVMAHVPDLNGFVRGMSILLADDGLITVENPYVRDLVDHCEFDTIYHEHFCYYSCTAVSALANRHGLYLNHVDYFSDLHGGTLRWHLGKKDEPSAEALAFLAAEKESGLTEFGYYQDFGARVAAVKTNLLALLQKVRSEGARVVGYGAAAKGSTLLNYVGIGGDLVDVVADRNTHKQGRHMPGTHQPVVDPEVLTEERPEYALLLVWNFAAEVMRQQQEYLDNGGRFIVPVPDPRIVP
jgi:SAM-dependent methyltransferase